MDTQKTFTAGDLVVNDSPHARHIATRGRLGVVVRITTGGAVEVQYVGINSTEVIAAELLRSPRPNEISTLVEKPARRLFWIVESPGSTWAFEDPEKAFAFMREQKLLDTDAVLEGRDQELNTMLYAFDTTYVGDDLSDVAEIAAQSGLFERDDH